MSTAAGCEVAGKLRDSVGAKRTLYLFNTCIITAAEVSLNVALLDSTADSETCLMRTASCQVRNLV